jgi:hypothetical protein
VSQIREIAVTCSPTALTAVAICRADGRSDTDPNAKRRPEPAHEPMSRVMSADSTVVCASVRLVSE